MSKKFLFLCTTNTCLSVMAEAIANNLFKQKGLPFVAGSAGLCVFDTQPPTQNTIKIIMDKLSLDVSAHKSTQITELALSQCEKLYCMTRVQEINLKEVFSKYQDKILLISQNEIQSPKGSNLNDFEATYEQLKLFIEGLF